MRALGAAHPDDYQPEWLPPYAPELNPEELCSGAVKQEVLKALPESVAELPRPARRAFIRLGHRSTDLRGSYRHAGRAVT